MDFEGVINKAGDKSSVWHHFLRNKNKSEAKCKLCQKILKSGGGSTSSLQKHLKNIHKINLVRVTTQTTSAQDSASTIIELPGSEVPKKKSKLTDFYESDANPSMEVMVSRMASIDGISLRTFTTSQDLRYLFEKNSNKLPKTADTIRNKILKECEKRKLEVTREIKVILSDEKKFSLSFDEWTSNRNRRYVGLTLHSPNFVGACTFRNLGLIRIYGSMNAAKCVQLIESKLGEYGVSLTQDIIAQTTDGCSLMVAFGKSLKSYHQLCIAHAIQLAIVDVMYTRNKDIEEDIDAPRSPQMIQEQLDELDDDLPLSELALRIRTGEISNETDESENNNDEDDGIEFYTESPLESLPPQSFRYHQLVSKIRNVVKMFKKSPTKNDDILQKHVKADFGQEYSLLLDGKTRWSSIATMLSRFLKLKTSITKALIDLNIDIVFTDDDWKYIEELNNILDIIKTVVEALCRRDATLLTADVSIKFAIKKLQEINTDLSNKMVAALRKQYKKRRLVQASTLQYLTNPEKYFESISDDDPAIFIRPTSDEMLREIVDLIQRTKQCSLNEIYNLQEDDLQVSSLTNKEELNKELIQAIASAPEPRSNDLNTTVRVEMALFENCGQRQRGRYLSLAYEHLQSIPPTSVEPERIFSSAGIVCNRLCSSLSDKTLDALIFLRSFYLLKKKKQ